jgi:hypothetical protein
MGCAMHTTKTFLAALLLLGSLTLLPGCMGDRQLFPETSFKALDRDRIELTTAATPIPGLTLAAGSQVKFKNDRIASITLSQETVLEGLTFPAASELVFTAWGGHLEMEHAVLGEDHEYDGLALLAGDKVRFREGKIVWANVANEHDIGGKTYPAEANLTIKNGRVVGASTAEERAAKAEAAARERQNRYDACTMQCAPLTGIPRANCINNCQTYR